MPDTALSFITSLRHPDTTDDYAGVVALLDDTLRSLDAQLDRRFEVVVVANRRYEPPAGLGFPVRSVEVGFERPPRKSEQTKDQYNDSIKLDKGLKLSVAMSRSSGTHAMCLDSDDFVSRRVVGYVAQNAGSAKGWYVDRGIRYDAAEGLYRAQKNFNDVCGTSLIWRSELMPAADFGDDPVADDVIAAYGRDRVTEELGSHRALRRRYGFAPIPFPAAAYVVNHGRNHSASARSLLGLPISRAHAAEYGITPPPVGTVRRNALGQLRPTHLRVLGAAVKNKISG